MKQESHSLIDLYLKGDWLELSDLLSSQIQYSANIGDSIQLSCMLSHYGCCQIHLGKQYKAHIIYKFFEDCKQSPAQFTVKEQAFVYRFLALYSIFEGDLHQANQYYEKAMEAFQILDEPEEEAIMLMEALRWLYSLLNDHAKNAYIYDRLNSFQGHDRPLFFKIYFPTFSENGDEWVSEFWNYINFYSKSELYSHPFIALFQTLQKELQSGEKEKAKNRIYSLLAKDNQYKHPLLKTWAYLLAGYTLQKSEYIEDALKLVKALNLTHMLGACNASNLKKDSSLIPRKRPHFKYSETSKLSFFLFREWTIFVDQNRLNNINWKRKKAEEILLYLLIQPNSKVEKEQLLEAFYPEVDSKKAENRLYVLVHEINRQFSEIVEEPLVSIKTGKVTLDLHVINEIDIQAYLKLYSVGSQLWFAEREEAVMLFEKARNQYDNQFVPHILYSDWLNQFRIHLKEKQIDLLQKLYTYYQDSNLKELLLHELIECDPLNEDFIREKILFLHSRGRTFEAKQFYRKQKELLKEELGLEFNFVVDVIQ